MFPQGQLAPISPIVGSGPVSGGNPYHMHSSTGIMILFLALERVLASHPPDPHFVHDMFPTEIRNAGAHLNPYHVGQELPAVKMNTVFTRPICLRQAVLCPSPQVRKSSNVGRILPGHEEHDFLCDIYDSLFSVLDLHGFSDIMILYSWCSCWVSCIKLCIDDNNMTPMPYHLPPAFASCPMFYVLLTLHYIPNNGRNGPALVYSNWMQTV